jgi:hypothetical protein
LKHLEKQFSVSLPKFYHFFNTLMNSLPIFYRDNVIRRKISATPENTTRGEEEICPICEDNKVSVMLDCYVRKKF